MARPAARRIVLFQFHKDWPLCKDRIQLLRILNPGVRVFGLYGGPTEAIPSAEEALANDLDHFFSLNKDAPWPRRHTDLAMRLWFSEVGQGVTFDVLHSIQWDLLLFAPLAEAYRNVPADALGLTGITLLENIQHKWHWATFEPDKAELLLLQEWARNSAGKWGPPLACLGPGYCVPRSFLEEFAALEVPELGHDESRLPMSAQLMGFPLADTGFYPRWFDSGTERLFNASDVELDPRTVLEELDRPGGRRAFHPCRESFGPDFVQEGLSRVSSRSEG